MEDVNSIKRVEFDEFLELFMDHSIEVTQTIMSAIMNHR